MSIADIETITLRSNGAILYKSKMFDFYMEHEFVDTEIILADGKIQTHSTVLASESKKAHKMLISQTGPKKILKLTRIPKAVMRIVLEYVYKGFVTYPKSLDNEVKLVGSFLELEGINDKELPSGNDSFEVIIIDDPDVSTENCVIDNSGSKNSPVILNDSFDFLNCPGDSSLKHSPKRSWQSVLAEKGTSASSNVCNSPKRKKRVTEVETPFLSSPSQKQPVQINTRRTPSPGPSHQDEKKSVSEMGETTMFPPPGSSHQDEKKSLSEMEETTTLPPRQQHSSNKQDRLPRTPPPGPSHQDEKKSVSEMGETIMLPPRQQHSSKKQDGLLRTPSPGPSNIRKTTKLAPLQDASKEQVKNANKKVKAIVNEDTWMNKNKLLTMGNSYCVLCEKPQSNITMHIKHAHRKTHRKAVHKCDRCSKRFYHEVFLRCHTEICNE